MRKSAIKIGLAEGLAEGKSQSIRDGQKEEKISIAKNIINDNVSLKAIIKYTKLS